jgi:hypothetical protein
MTDVRLRHLPSVDSLLRRERVAGLIESMAAPTCVAICAVVLTQLRRAIAFILVSTRLQRRCFD